jgi:hypothetical protein
MLKKNVRFIWGQQHGDFSNLNLTIIDPSVLHIRVFSCRLILQTGACLDFVDAALL